MSDLFDQFGVDPSTGQSVPQQQQAPSPVAQDAPAQPAVDLFDKFNVNPNTGRTNPPKPLGNVNPNKGAWSVAVDNFVNNFGKLPLGIAQAQGQNVNGPLSTLSPLGMFSDPTVAKGVQNQIDSNEANAMDKSYQHPDAAAAGATLGDFAQGAVSTLLMPWMKAKAAAGALAKAGTFLTNTGGQGTALGAAQAIPSDSGQSRLMNAAVGGGAGVVLGGALGAGGAALRGIGNKIVKPVEGISAERAARAADAKAAGVDLPLGAVTQDASTQSREENLIKATEGDASNMMRGAYSTANKQVIASLNKIREKVGSSTNAMEAAGGQAQDVLQNMNRGRLSKISGIYEEGKNAAGSNLDVNTSNIVDAHDSVLDNYAEVKFSPVVNKALNSLREPNSNLSVKDAVKLAQNLNQVIRSTDHKPTQMAAKSILNQVYDSLDGLANSGGYAGDAAQVFGAARDARKALGDIFNQDDIVENVVSKKAQFTNEMSPDQVAPAAFKNVTNMNKIKGALLSPGLDGQEDNAGRTAWNNLRSAKFNQILDSSIENGKINYSKLNKAYNKAGDKVMGEVVGDSELHQQLKTILRVASYLHNKQDGVVNYSNSANLMNRLASNAGKNFSRLIGIGVGGFTGGTAGSLVGSLLPEIVTFLKNMSDKKFVQSSLEAAAQSVQRAARPGLGDRLPSSSPAVKQLITNTGAVKASQS